MKVQKAREMDNKKGPSIETIPTLYMRGTVLRVHASFQDNNGKGRPGWVSDLDLACLKHQIAECCDHVHVVHAMHTDTEENSCTGQ
jgi:hypothetical protein